MHPVGDGRIWTQTQLRDAFHAAGLRGGDIVLVHSALRTLGPVEGGADAVIDALIETLAPGGTLAMPTHNLSCCTLFHGCEEWAGLPAAVSARPIQLYSIAASGQVIPVPLHHHVVRTGAQYPCLEPFLIAAGAMTVTRLGTCELRLLDVRATADCVVARLRQDPSIIQPK